MSKAEARALLLKTFNAAAVEGFLSKFPDDYPFSAAALVGDFVDYINDLPPISKHPDE